MPLSVIITTFNEAAHIGAALESVRWADDIIVVDSFSTDDTVAIAHTYTQRVLQRAYKGPADQKNWAIPQARHEWILLLDADERITPDLQAEIQHWLAQPDIPYDAFWIGRQNHFLGRRVRYSGWQGDAVVRFFRKSCRYNHKQVHEEIELTGLRVGRLQYKMEHYTFRNARHFLDKMQRYGAWSAQDYAAKTPRVTYFHLFWKPLFRFGKHFIVQQGWRDGRVGLVISILMAWGVFLRYLYLLETTEEKLKS
ncbi:MAG TPA: glycosyltransferase family 2 protein [Saprospiraceae bacterium]|nr:glycosyltransferase family 2 protein [Saprospiraceae bacterium]HMP25397.1 glycosyltransferase family 2 protein [Saprospiraceae bacterium]